MSTATETLETPIEPIREVVASDYEALWQEQREENDRLRAIISAAKIKPVSDHPAKDARPGITADALRAQVGDVAWLNMSKTQKISGLGVDPATVDEALLYRVFGRGADSSAGRDLFASNPLRYRQLKECAKALHIYGAEPPKR